MTPFGQKSFTPITLLVLVLLAGLVILAPQPMGALGGSTPIIRAIVPGSAATGFGQLVTIQGFNLFDPGNPGLTVVNFTQDGTCPAGCPGFVFASPSNPHEVYVRLPFALVPGKARVTVKTLDDGLVSDSVGFRVLSKPTEPIPRKLVAIQAGFPTITTATPGQEIGIQAYGTDTVGVTAVFSQGTVVVAVPATLTLSNAVIGVVSQVTVPASFTTGPALVQLKVTVNGVDSDLSFALRFTIAAVDQEQPVIDASVGGLAIGGSSEQKLAQVVTPGLSGRLTEVRFPVACDSGIGSLIVEIQGVGADGKPNGVVLASEAFPASTLPTFFPAPPSFRSLPFSTPASVTAGTPFAIVLSSTVLSTPPGGCGVFQGPVGNPYPGGDAFFDARPNAAGVWVPLGPPRFDLAFQTVVAP